jgi:hypothetical protein
MALTPKEAFDVLASRGVEPIRSDLRQECLVKFRYSNHNVIINLVYGTILPPQVSAIPSVTNDDNIDFVECVSLTRFQAKINNLTYSGSTLTVTCEVPLSRVYRADRRFHFEVPSPATRQAKAAHKAWVEEPEVAPIYSAECRDDDSTPNQCVP